MGLLLSPGFNLFETPQTELARQLLRHGRLSFDAPPNPAAGPYRPGLGGRYYSTHEIGALLLAMPFAAAAQFVHATTGLPFKQAFEFLMAVESAALFGLLLVAMLWELPERPAEARSRALALLALLLSSQYLVYLGFPADVSMSAAVMALLLLAWRKATGGGLAAHLAVGVAGGLLVLLKISNALVLPTAAALVLAERAWSWRARLARLGAMGLGALPALALTAWWNYVRMGSAFITPYPAGHDLHLGLLPQGLAASLLSPRKGLLLFTPTLVLAPLALKGLLAHPLLRREALLVLGSFVLTLLRLSASEIWHGRAGWGNRYYVPWLPVLMLMVAQGLWWRPAGSRVMAIVRSAALAAGLVINLAGLLTNFHYRAFLCDYEPWPSSMNTCALAALPGNLARTAGLAVPELVLPGASAAYVFVSNRLTLWWYALRVAGVPAYASWAIGLGLLALAVVWWRAALARAAAGATDA